MQQLPLLDWTGSWFAPWAQTPGFGGFAAVVAATIAFAASRYQARVQRVAQRKEQWWKRAEWALNLTLSDDPARRECGLEVLDALADSEWSHEHERDVIRAAIREAIFTCAVEENMINDQLIIRADERSADDGA